ncbi:MAG TPA: protein kinase [Planctomycetota bacterium]|nr:protein kinase [Planctomycetota bacterium]
MDADRVGDLFRFLGGSSLFGRLAVLNGTVTEDQLQAARAADGRPIAEVLVELGFLTPAQRAELEAQEAEILRGDRSEPSGRAIGHYLLVEELGGGQAGVVWKAWDTKLQRWVAVKEARQELPFARERFLREARASAKVRHPHLVQALEIGRHEDRDYIVMNLVEGRPLHKAALPPGKAVAVMADIADAVAALHAAGVLHRDIKPQNILIDEKDHGWLADFGIARDRSAQPLTLDGTLMGTPVYMAPEQALGKQDLVKEPADVYGLGSTLYQAVTGRAPFLAEDDLKTLLRRLSDEPPPAPRSINPEIPEDLDFIIRRALEKHPEDRYPSAAALTEDLRRFLRGQPPVARPAGPIVRGVRWLRREPRHAVMALVLVGIVAVAFWGFLGYERHERYLAAYQEGVDLFTRGATGEALSKFMAAAEADPARPEPWLMEGRCLLRMKFFEQAEGSWTRALARDPSFGPALLERGKAAVEAYVQKRLPPATRASGGRIRFGAPEPERPEDRERRRRGEADLQSARTARGLDPVELRFLEGALAYGRGLYKDAAVALAEYVHKNAWDAAGFSLHAAASYLSGDFAAADKSLTRAIELQPRPDRYRSRGDVRYGAGRYAEAVDDYAKADQDPAARCGRGLALQALGRHADAVAEYTRALELKPGYARALNNRGTARVELLDLPGAQVDFEAALESNEFYAEAYHNLGNVLLLQNRAADAVRQYDLAIGCDGAYVEAYVHRARARLKLDKPGDAVSDLETALKFDPANPDTMLDLALILRARGDVSRAMSLLEKAMVVAPSSWTARSRAEKLREEWKR